MTIIVRRAASLSLTTAVVALMLTACGSNSDKAAEPNDSKGGPAKSSVNAPAPETETPGALAWLRDGDVCHEFNKIDASRYLGSSPSPSVSTPCGATQTLPNELGTQVWVAGGQRVTVQVLVGDTAFKDIRDQPSLKDSQLDCSIGLNITMSSHECVDSMAENGALIVNMGRTALVVFASQEAGPDNTSEVKLTTKSAQRKLTDFTIYVANTMYYAS